MNNYEELITKYQHLFSEDCYIQCDVGWYELISNLLNLIDAEQKYKDRYLVPKPVEKLQIVTMKEKFGAFRCYVDGGNDYISGLIDFAESMSGTICEHCGNPGYARSGSWIKTLCDNCHNTMK